MHPNLIKTFPGYSVIELTLSLLLGTVILGIVFMAFRIYSESNSRMDDIWTRISMAEEFLRNPIDCDASRYSCSGNINIYKTDASVLVAADGSSRLRGYAIIAKCDAGKVRVQYLREPSDPTKWTDLLPDSLPLCVGTP